MFPMFIPLPSEITIDNWNNASIYQPSFMPFFKAKFSFYKQLKNNNPDITDKEINKLYFNSLAQKTWRILYPEIADYINKKGGYDKLTIEYKNYINLGIMINIEFLLRNYTIEKLFQNNLSIQNFNYTDDTWQVYSDKSFIGEECWRFFQKLGMLRLGYY